MKKGFFEVFPYAWYKNQRKKFRQILMTNEFPCVMNIWIITIKLNIMHCHLLLCYTFSFKKGEYLISIYLYVFIGCNVWGAPFRVTLTKKLSLSDISCLNLQTVSDNWQYLQTFSQSWKFRSQFYCHCCHRIFPTLDCRFVFSHCFIIILSSIVFHITDSI